MIATQTNKLAGGVPRVRALLLAGGLGTRLRPLTDTLPKCLATIAGRPMLDYWVDQLASAGVSEATVNTHAHADQVRAYLERVNASGRLRLREFYEPTLLGSAGTVAANADLADGVDEVLIIYADNLSDVDLAGMLAYHRTHGDAATMLLFRAENPKACGIVELDGAARVISFVEKPAEPKSDLANAGVYVLSADAYREAAAMRAFDLGFDVLPKFVGRMRGWTWEGYHRDIGTLAALEQARRDFDERARTKANGAPRRAIFLDRDGTLVEHVHYLADPAQVRLLPGVAQSLQRWRDAGYLLVVVSNQSAVGRGMITTDDVERVNAEMRRQLAEAGAAVDAEYYCPVAPLSADRSVIEHPDRKPGPGMLLRAAREHAIDLAQSWMVGDLPSDAWTGRNAGCRGSILVSGGQNLTERDRAATADFPRVENLAAAVEFTLAEDATARR